MQNRDAAGGKRWRSIRSLTIFREQGIVDLPRATFRRRDFSPILLSTLAHPGSGPGAGRSHFLPRLIICAQERVA